MKKLFAFLALLILVALFAVSAFADGKVTAPAPSDPVASWRILDVRNAIADPVNPVGIIEIGYFTQGGKFHHSSVINLQGEAYFDLLAALGHPWDATVEASMTRVNAAGATVPDARAINNFRLSKYLISIGELPDVTADKPANP